jgi:hypothetical protein
LNEDFPAYHLCTAKTFHSNFTLRLKKKLVGFSHYGHFSFLWRVLSATEESYKSTWYALKVSNIQQTVAVFSSTAAQ